MRRKSERNKAKASPEKKVEKPTRKSTRRRAKKSPSTSPERDNSNDAEAIQSSEKETVYKIQTRLHSKEIETTSINDEIESKVSSTESIQQDVTEDSGSVWKAARADASPGEIPKLKLCRQRNLSETSDVSLTRKRGNKWQESGDGVTEEADSADEKPATSTAAATMMTDVSADEPADNPSSTIPNRDSGEEVSDSKEIPPENASVDLSDDKQNIDRQDDTTETTDCTTVTNDVSHELAEAEPPIEETDVVNTQEDINDEVVKPQEEKEEEEEEVRDVEKTVAVDGEEFTEPTKADQEPTIINDTVSSEDEKVKEKEVEEEEKEVKKHVVEPSGSSDNSNDESKTNVKRGAVTRVQRASRRKHRDKYRDSSNSDSAESDDEPVRRIEKIEKQGDDEEESEISREVIQTNEESHQSPDTQDTPLTTDNKVTDEEKQQEQKENENNFNEKNKIDANSECHTAPVCKSAKVNLKRSFNTRISVDTVENKKDGVDENNTSQDKGNHVSGDQDQVCNIPKRRRWGTARTTDTTPTVSISTDSLKVLVPGAKPLPMSEVRLTKDDDDDRDRRREREKRYGASDGLEEKRKDESDLTKNENIKNDNHIASRRKISIVKDTPHIKSPSPSQSNVTSILLIKNLVRPFTLNQIKELLSRTGVIVENGFWMDRIKSKCFVEYSNEDQAFETRQALHGISWPLSNPKKLQVDYATKSDMEQARESSKDQVPSRKTEPMVATDVWQQDWGRDEKGNATTKVTVVREWDLGKEDGQHLLKDKDREKKDIDKKRRQRSRSPAMDTHLPAPARKFKKKEDDPPPAKLLDDLFRKTKATPCIYWLPLTNEQIVVKEEMRRQTMAENARRLEEMRRAERNRDGRRRRSPRK